MTAPEPPRSHDEKRRMLIKRMKQEGPLELSKKKAEFSE
jgi:hypothetical protein